MRENFREGGVKNPEKLPTSFMDGLFLYSALFWFSAFTGQQTSQVLARLFSSETQLVLISLSSADSARQAVSSCFHDKNSGHVNSEIQTYFKFKGQVFPAKTKDR